MTSKRSLTIKIRILSARVLSLAALTVLIAFAAPAQEKRPLEDRQDARAKTLGTLLSFLPAVTYPSGGTNTSSVAVADVNGDGKPDLIITNSYACSPPFCLTGTVDVLMGNGDGTFQTAVSYGAGGSETMSVAVGDVNGDGKLDLVVANHCLSVDDCPTGTVGVLLGNGDGTFQPVVTYGPGAYGPFSVAVADVNGDGKPDLLVANMLCVSVGTGCVGVLLGNGDGTFQPAIVYGSGPEYGHSLAVADVNADGKLDLLVGSTCMSSDICTDLAGVLLGNGDGTFQTVVTYNSGDGYQSSVGVADVNGDGRPDLLVANLDSSTAGVLLGNGDGTFQPVVTYNSGGATFAYPQSVAAADVNGDGKLDLLATNEFDQSGLQGSVGVLLGNGDGTFQPAVPFSSGGYTALSLAVADVNGDGRLDVLVANFSGSVGVLLNNPGVQSTTSTSLVSSLNPSIRGLPITFTATVISAKGPPPNGETVTFYNGLNVLGTASLSGGIASLTKSSLGSGIHTISAAYLGDATFTGSTSPTLEQVVDTTSQSPTTTALTSSLNPSIYGQKVTWTATVTTAGKNTPTGNVNFNWGSNYIGTAKLNSSGVATLTRSSLSADAYPLFAVYAGDANNGPSASPILNQVITQATSTATLTSSPNPSTQGQSVTFTAKITSPTTTPTGPVTFTAGKTTLGTVELTNGKATFTTSTLAVGSTTVTVTYPWNSNISESSASVTQVVQ
jgi:hypothetical protein